MELQFSDKFDCIICLNAVLPPVEFFNKLSSIMIIAADGAANKLIETGVIPDYIIGDMDSFDSKFGNYIEKTIIISNPDQETTDFEKILLFAIENNISRLLIAGFHGGELEHTLNNWSIYMRYASQLNLCIYDNGRYGIAVNKSFSMPAMPNEIISLIPQPEAIITTHGLKWQLQKEMLLLGRREGARNRAISNTISVEIHSGELLIFFENKIPYAPSYIKTKS